LTTEKQIVRKIVSKPQSPNCLPGSG